MNNLLDIQNLSKRYNDFELQNVTLSVPAGRVVGFIGANGAGKTTTIKAALGLIRPDSGSISLFGNDCAEALSNAHAASTLERIGVVFDTCAFPTEIDIADVESMMRHSYRSWDRARFEHLRDLFSLGPKKKVKELSRGMGMKLMLACALSHNADLLILDEATAGLDPLARDEVLDILHRFMVDENHSIFISSHITSDLEKIADYIVCIDNGRIVFSVAKDSITDQAGVAHCRTDEFEQVAASGFFQPGDMHFIKHAYGISLLVPDRFAFAESFKAIAVDRASIDDYMGLVLKGGTR